MHAYLVYLATVCRDLSAELVHVGGVADHLHIVTTLPRTISQAEFIEQIKKASSKWVKDLDARYRGFFWQRGYGVFFSESEPAEGRTAVCRGATRAPPHSNVSGGISRTVTQARH
jgi:REP element-mobilizing transposase RayT